MTGNYYTPMNYNREHTTCSSRIYNYDFGGYTSMSDMANEIISDWKFDEQCRKNIENRNRERNK